MNFACLHTQNKRKERDRCSCAAVHNEDSTAKKWLFARLFCRDFFPLHNCTYTTLFPFLSSTRKYAFQTSDAIQIRLSNDEPTSILSGDESNQPTIQVGS